MFRRDLGMLIIYLWKQAKGAKSTGEAETSLFTSQFLQLGSTGQLMYACWGESSLPSSPTPGLFVGISSAQGADGMSTVGE